MNEAKNILFFPSEMREGVDVKFHQIINIHLWPKFQCPDCGFAFVRKDKFEDHCRTHTGEKPFSCSHCDKTFMRKYELVKHERIHNGEGKDNLEPFDEENDQDLAR